MDSSESPFSNLDLWCDWSGDPGDKVHVCMTVEVWCMPDTQIALLDTSHPAVSQIWDSSLDPLQRSRNPRKDGLFYQMTDKDASTYNNSTQASPVSMDQVNNLATPRKQFDPMTPNKMNAYASLRTVHPNLSIDTRSPSDSGSVLRAGHTPDGSPGTNLDVLYASFMRDGSSSEFLSETGQSPTNPRKRTAKAASLPDSVTDSERSYGGQKLKDKSRVLAKGRQSPVSSSSSSSKHSRTRSLIPRRVSVINQMRVDLASVHVPADSAPGLDAELRQSENDVSQVENEDQDDTIRVEHKGFGKVYAGNTLTPVSSPPIKTSLDLSIGDAGKPLQEGPDLEKVSTVASAGSPCDMAFMSESIDASLGEIPTHRKFLVQPPTPPRTIHRPRLVLVDQVFHIECPSDIKSAWYKASVTLTLHLQPRCPRGWYELIVPGLPRLGGFDHGYVYLRIPDGQGLEYRTSNFKRYEIVEGCLIAQFLPVQSKLVLHLRPCDGRFYGFLRDFKVNQTLRTRVIPDTRDSASYIVEFTTVCSLDLIQRDFWAEQCGFSVYIQGGPNGEYSCHLDQPRTNFQTIQLDSDPGSERGLTQLQIICAPTNLKMFAITWDTRLPHAEAINWMPQITALPEGNRAEEELKTRYLDAEDDELEVVRGEVKSRLVAPKRSREAKGFVSCLIKTHVFLVFVLCFLQPLAYFVGLYDRILGDDAGRETLGSLCEKFMLCERKEPSGPSGEHVAGVTLPVLETLETAGGPVPIAIEPARWMQGRKSLETDSLSQEMVRSVAPSMRDRLDYFLGWKGPPPDAGSM